MAWHQHRIDVLNDVILITLNGTTARYTIPDPNVVHFPPPYDPNRGRYASTDPSYTTAFRNIRVTVL